jgi:hypothetical protein
VKSACYKPRGEQRSRDPVFAVTLTSIFGKRGEQRETALASTRAAKCARVNMCSFKLHQNDTRGDERNPV